MGCLSGCHGQSLQTAPRGKHPVHPISGLHEVAAARGSAACLFQPIAPKGHCHGREELNYDIVLQANLAAANSRRLAARASANLAAWGFLLVKPVQSGQI
jgi:hypothetical protein